MFKKKCSILDTPSLENTLDIFIGKIDKFIQSFWEKRDRKLLKPDQAESFFWGFEADWCENALFGGTCS
jgi:hypothetical protein